MNIFNLNFKGDLAEVENGIEELANLYIFKDKFNGEEICVNKCSGGLIVEGNGDNYNIFYCEKVEFFRGLAILTDKIRNGITVFRVSENKRFDTCGIMIDVSRNAVLKVSSVKDIIRRMALMGLNLMMLYTEDTYKMEKYPYFGYMRGAYTKEELKEINKYSGVFGVELVPCIQTLGHLRRTLRWSYANDIKDTSDILLIDEPKTYEFIEEMIKTISECFTSRKIHIGMDEAHGVGFGKYFTKHGYKDKYELLSYHLSKVIKILEKYNLKPMMWSDMFFRVSSKTNEYYDANAVMPSNISDEIPGDISMVYWDYYNEDAEMYRAMIKSHKQMERNIIFAGGIWTWNGVSINYEKTFRTTKTALRVCSEENIKDVIATMWGDDGAETSIYAALLGMQLYAEYNYYDDVCNKHLSKMFNICTGYDMDSYMLLDIDNFGIADTGVTSVVISKQVLYQDVLQGLFDKNFEIIDLKLHYQNILNKLSNINEQADLEYLFDYQRQLVKTLWKKCDIGIRLEKAYKLKNNIALRKISDELRALSGDIKVLHEKLAYIWYKNNKAFGFDILDLRFGGIIARIERAINRIMLFLNGEIIKIEELEEKRLFYSGFESAFVHDYSSGNIMSV